MKTDDSAPILSQAAQAIVNDWILNRLPDRFTALEPKRMAAGDIWCVPVGLAYLNIGVDWSSRRSSRQRLLWRGYLSLST
jgi:hypothetical protein